MSILQNCISKSVIYFFPINHGFQTNNTATETEVIKQLQIAVTNFSISEALLIKTIKLIIATIAIMILNTSFVVIWFRRGWSLYNFL